MLFIKEHIYLNILVELQLALDLTAPLNGNPRVPFLKVELHKLIRRRKKTGEFPPAKDVFERRMITAIEGLEAEGHSRKEAQTIMVKASGGRTAKIFLRFIVDECRGKENIDEFYARFFHLFKLINPHKPAWWMTEEEFNRHNGYYGKTYVGYQAAQVRKLIY